MSLTLKACRVNRGFTQTQAAKKIGIAVDTLSKYERGLSFPNVPTIKKIEQVYCVSYEDIIFTN